MANNSGFIQVCVVFLCAVGIVASSFAQTVPAAAPNSLEHFEVVDPTRPIHFIVVDQEQQETEQRLQLQAVYRSGQRQWAVINDQVLSQGERVHDATLVRIAEDRVVIERGGVEQVLRLRPAVIRTPLGTNTSKGEASLVYDIP